MPAVSVLIPCYNAVHTLDEALQSLVQQTFKNFEVAAVDDGSTDGSGELLDAWAGKEPRLRVIHQAHGGIVSALNAGWQASTAPLIARMDADDRCASERLARQVAWMKEQPQTAVLGSRVQAFTAPESSVGAGFNAGAGFRVGAGFNAYIEWSNSLLSDAEMRREIFVESPLVHPSVMLRRALLGRQRPYEDHGWAEDYDLWLRLALGGAQFAKLPETLLEWRESPQRLTRADSRYSPENFLRARVHYLLRGPLAGRDAVILWGAGLAGRQLSKYLLLQGAPLVAFVDIDPRKIGNLRRGKPILPPEALLDCLKRYRRPIVLATVGARGARPIVRARLNALGLREGEDWWAAA